MRLLIIDDDPELGPMLAEALTNRGHVVDHVATGEDGIWRAGEQPYDAVILDVGLPDMTGMQVCGHLRQRHPALPMLMLTGRTDVQDRVRGLDAGADDYLSKPVSLAELDARLRSLNRRAQRPVVEQHVVGDVVVIPDRCEVWRQQQQVVLVGKEYALVELLVRRAGALVSREHLMAQLWEHDAEVTDNALDVLVAAVRRKLDAPFDEPVLHTARGRGYRLSGDTGGR